MRLPEMPHRDSDLTPEIERELDAIERGLAGDSPDPDPELAELMALATEIRDERPIPREDVAAALDRLAAAGFRSGGRSRFDAARARLSALSPMRMALPAGSLATILIAAVVTVSVLNDDPVGNDTGGDAQDLSGDGDDAVSSPGFEGTAPPPGSPEPLLLEKAPPIVDGYALDAPDADSAGSGISATAERLSSGEAEISYDRRATYDRRTGSVAALAPAPPSRDQKIAPGQDNRRVDRDAYLSISTKPEEVRETTDKAVSIVRGFGGIIASSQVTDGADGASSFIEISVPTRNLDAALDQLTQLGNVESLNEATVDITKPFVSARDQIRDARAERRSILDALSTTTDPVMITELKRQANRARLEISRAKADFDNIARQARLSSISLEILGDPEAADDWSISDALEDAKDVLRTAAGVGLVTGAILVPLALLVLLFALALRALRGGRRERALDE